MNDQFGFTRRTHRYSYHERQGGGKSDEVGNAHVESELIVRSDFSTFSLVERMLDSDEDEDVKVIE